MITPKIKIKDYCIICGEPICDYEDYYDFPTKFLPGFICTNCVDEALCFSTTDCDEEESEVM